MSWPAENIILFDGVCGFCASSVPFVIRHDRRGIFKFVSIQSPLGQEIYRAHGLDPEDMQTFLVVTRAGPKLRSDAALEIARQLGGFWRLFGIFKVVPKRWRDWVYSILARNRYRWFGRRATCLVPSAQDRARFLA